ncbi:MAG: hypothetical protein AB1330_01210 [Bacillota bacterium]
MLTAVQALQRLSSMGVQKTLADIEAALNAIDQQVIFDEQRQRVTVQVWDKATPINGVAPEKIIARDDVPDDGEIYLLYVDGKLVYLQPHDPFQAGVVPMTSETVVQLANQHADQIATQMADDKTFEVLLTSLA